MKLQDLFEDASFPVPTPKNIDARYSVDGIKIDNIKGLGATPYNQDCSYRGFAAWITPSKFLQLALPDPEVDERGINFEKLMKEQPIGNPFFTVSYSEGMFKIQGHEGRGRMGAIRRLNHDKPFPVHFIGVQELRARHLTPEIMESLVNGEPVQSERRSMVSLETKEIFWLGKTIRP